MNPEIDLSHQRWLSVQKKLTNPIRGIPKSASKAYTEDKKPWISLNLIKQGAVYNQREL